MFNWLGAGTWRAGGVAWVGGVATGEASLAIDVARELEHAPGDRPREPEEDDDGTGRGPDGNGICFEPDIVMGSQECSEVLSSV